MNVTRLPNGRQQFTHPSTGAPLVGGKVWHYIPGTTIVKDTYQNQAGTVANTNPIILDAYGSAVIWGDGAYRQVLLDANNNQLWDEDTSSGISSAMADVTGAASKSAAMSALGISPAWQPVVGNATLSGGMVSMGISLVMQPVVGAATLADARTALGVDEVGLEVYNVKAYGAVGDGVTDDRAAIQAAIDACPAGIVYFPSGNYSVSGTVFIKPGISLWGNSMFTSNLIASANGVNIVGYIAPALASGFDIRDLGFSSGGFTGCAGIYIDGVDASKRCSIVNLRNVYVGPMNVAVYLNFCANVVVDNFFSNTSGTGLWLRNCADVAVSNSKAQNGAAYGFYIQGGPGAYDEGIKLVNCSTNGQAFGIAVIDQDWGQVVNSSFTTCASGPGIWQNSDNWRISTTDFAAANAVTGLIIDANCNNVQVSECFFALNTFGVSIAGSRNSVRGCNFTANTNVDIILTNAGQTSVANNTCDSASVPQSIVESGTTNYSNIIGNTVFGTVVVVGVNSLQTGTVSY